MINVGIVGATGYTGVELLRLLVRHPQAAIRTVTSRTEAGRQVSALFPSLRGHLDLAFAEPERAPLRECDLVYFATPNGTAMTMVPALLEAGARVIDLSADFRLKSADEWMRWYGSPHACPQLLEDAVYGLPELRREEIKRARLVANPGCYPTAVILGLAPLLEAGVIEATGIIADAKSGVSGAGRTASDRNLYCETGDNFHAYAVSGHRHLPEIRQELGEVLEGDVGIVFVPHLVPMLRGIHATLYARPRSAGSDPFAALSRRYRGEPFVDVIAGAVHPDTRSVRGSNTCRIAVHRPPDVDAIVVLSVIDNLVKGAAGQAVQNMNLMMGLPETLGLDAPAMMP
jgi:N-acetyl-gamma-glutamyl-phosphate reductase